MNSFKEATVCHLLRGANGSTEVLLAKRATLFAQGKWNGPGGKFWKRETMRHCLWREVKEEVGTIIDPSSAKHFASVDFYHKHHDGYRLEWVVHFLAVDKWEGEPRPLEGILQVGWFPRTSMPYDLIMGDQIAWLPMALQGRQDKLLFGELYYSDTNLTAIDSFSFRFVDQKTHAFKRKHQISEEVR